jgi:hypothetical protein
MAEATMNISLKVSLKGVRSRENDVSEIKVDCIFPKCSVKQKTYRIVAKHFNQQHSPSYRALGIRCEFCDWSCYHNLRCYVVHLHQNHDVKVHAGTILNLKSMRKSKFSKHTFTCSAKVAEHVALTRELKIEERAVVKSLKKKDKVSVKAVKAKKNIPLESLLSEPTNDEDIVVVIDKETVCLLMDDSFDKYQYDSEDCVSDIESSDSDSGDDSPVKINTTKAVVKKLQGSKRKLNLSLEIVFDAKKSRLGL